ncbi:MULTISPECIES: DUF2267 domain-containing protein [Cyanophyceae]|uniref:DUF2267 domain-containing protein n=1 Tax=Cyanophyceae TaxID=3028117 RepID=UPI001687C09E|nr:DUF2267 domain-containing protein [Trichocoleus sp. FACHB-69]MBD1933440.1 DUF2267 domain-containing protein [Trichocoleus sp. FACHB-69]
MNYNQFIKQVQSVAQLNHCQEAERTTCATLEFYQRVSEREGVNSTHAATHARAVFTVLQEAATPGELEDIRANFFDNYQELFRVIQGIKSFN